MKCPWCGRNTDNKPSPYLSLYGRNFWDSAPIGKYPYPGAYKGMFVMAIYLNKKHPDRFYKAFPNKGNYMIKRIK